jgi:hypothetical protein
VLHHLHHHEVLKDLPDQYIVFDQPLFVGAEQVGE